MKFLKIIICILTVIYPSNQLRCGVDSLPPIEIKQIKPLKSNRVRNLQTGPRFDIFMDYTQLRNSNLPGAYLNNLINNLDKTVKLFQKLFSVKSDPIKILLDPNDGILEYYGINYFDRRIYEDGLDYDLVIYPKISDDLKKSNAEAAASPILEAPDPDPNKKNGRPCIGLVFLVSDYDFNKVNAEEYFEILLLHELSHVLGFNHQYFGGYTKNITVLGKEREILTFPTLVQKARKYFGCDSLEGVELENQGGSGTAGSHWESRTMYGDYMIGSEIGEHAISELTLAVFEDLGWYNVNYYTGGLFKFGKNQGCDFLTKPCIKNNRTNFGNEFCTIPNGNRCFPSRTSRGYCYVVNYPEEIEYQYFPKPTTGGYTYADYCPLPFSDRDDSMHYHDSCNSGRQKVETDIISPNSFCFVNTLTKLQYEKNGTVIDPHIIDPTVIASCNPVTCYPSDKTYTVKYGKDKVIKCPKNGGTVQVEGYFGEFYCPNYNMICTSAKVCNSMVGCIENEALPNDDAFDYSTFSEDSNILEPEQQAKAPRSSQGLSNREGNLNSNSYFRLNYFLALLLLGFI